MTKTPDQKTAPTDRELLVATAHLLFEISADNISAESSEGLVFATSRIGNLLERNQAAERNAGWFMTKMSELAKRVRR